MYGPTETTVWSSVHRVDEPGPYHTRLAARSPTREFISSIKGLQPVPIGVPGEIFIGGEGVARRAIVTENELTAEKFIPESVLGVETKLTALSHRGISRPFSPADGDD